MNFRGEYMNINEKYILLLQKVIERGNVVTCRKYANIELCNCQTKIDMIQPLITCKKRKMGYRFACAEAVWVITGDNTVAAIRPFSKQIENFSDDGVYFFGAYGPKIIDQLEYIGRCFKSDLYTRQAVINIWREKPPISKDIPCTLNLQFMIREDENGQLRFNTTVNMRSSDTWLGIPYDLFTFSMVSAYILLYLKKILDRKDIFLGELTLNAGSQHLYNDAFGYKIEEAMDLLNDSHINEDFTYCLLNIYDFKSQDDLLNHLISLLMYKRGLSEINFLKELGDYWYDKAHSTRQS
jgi:thymidylate synthase